jgi:hypothetical protein
LRARDLVERQPQVVRDGGDVPQDVAELERQGVALRGDSGVPGLQPSSRMSLPSFSATSPASPASFRTG